MTILSQSVVSFALGLLIGGLITVLTTYFVRSGNASSHEYQRQLCDVRLRLYSVLQEAAETAAESSRILRETTKIARSTQEILDRAARSQEVSI